MDFEPLLRTLLPIEQHQCQRELGQALRWDDEERASLARGALRAIDLCASTQSFEEIEKLQSWATDRLSIWTFVTSADPTHIDRRSYLTSLWFWGVLIEISLLRDRCKQLLSR